MPSETANAPPPASVRYRMSSSLISSRMSKNSSSSRDKRMSAPRKLQTARGTMALLTVLSLCLGIMLSDLKALRAGAAKAAPANATREKRDKLGPDLRQKLKESKGDEEIDVIIETDGVVLGDSPSTDLATTDGVVPGNNYEAFRMRSARVKAKKLEALAARGDVAHVSLDREVRLLGHVSLTTGADAAAAMGRRHARRHGRRHRRPRLRHRRDHARLQRRRRRPRIVYNKDFTGEDAHRRPLRPRHARRRARRRQRRRLGAAPTAASRPTRRSSTCACSTRRAGARPRRCSAALDWVLANRSNAAYNIRVVNLSLGTAGHRLLRERPAVPRRPRARRRRHRRRRRGGQQGQGRARPEGLRADPLARQRPLGHHRRRLEHLRHRRARGRRRGDLQLARPDPRLLDGRGGRRHYDNLVKPDLVAPGNKLVAAESPDNLLVTKNPALDANVDGARGQPEADVHERHLDGGARRRRARRR